MAETLVFFRDDDVGTLTDPLRFHLDLLIEFGVPCHYQVVPAYLDAACAAELRRRKAAHPDLVHFNQHGLHHEQIVNGKVEYAEFAFGRPYADQRQAIAEGRDQLAQHLGDAFSPDVFTPPCHKYDAETLRALGDLGFTVLSAGLRTDWPARVYYQLGRALGRVELLGKRVSYHRRFTPDARLAEVSVVVDVHEEVDGRCVRLEKTANDLWADFEAARRSLDAVGIMTHHQACDTPSKQAVLRAFVDRLARDPSVRFGDLLDLRPSRAAA